MAFDSINELLHYYKMYGNQMGLNVWKSNGI
ncbi:hypothetical protein TorRG33x02_308980 [Trema orientale]|uniref:Uncharacterized protein n=1 Tax=Trema orientale TaxID=63057 RepID=A0A2P5BU04_TREOI|nr:hypothetical protein TorRG33x02_308980 [Trema orientale]